MISTHKNCRSRGTMSKYIGWNVAFYEGYNKKIDFDVLNECGNFIDNDIVDKKIFWNLYGGMGKYYEKFGFKEFGSALSRQNVEAENRFQPVHRKDQPNFTKIN